MFIWSFDCEAILTGKLSVATITVESLFWLVDSHAVYMIPFFAFSTKDILKVRVLRRITKTHSPPVFRWRDQLLSLLIVGRPGEVIVIRSGWLGSILLNADDVASSLDCFDWETHGDFWEEDLSNWYVFAVGSQDGLWEVLALQAPLHLDERQLF